MRNYILIYIRLDFNNMSTPPRHNGTRLSNMAKQKVQEVSPCDYMFSRLGQQEVQQRHVLPRQFPQRRYSLLFDDMLDKQLIQLWQINRCSFFQSFQRRIHLPSQKRPKAPNSSNSACVVVNNLSPRRWWCMIVLIYIFGRKCYNCHGTLG